MRECANGTEVYPTTEAEICHAYICRRHAGLTTSLEDALGGRATLAARASSSAWKTSAHQCSPSAHGSAFPLNTAWRRTHACYHFAITLKQQRRQCLRRGEVASDGVQVSVAICGGYVM